MRRWGGRERLTNRVVHAGLRIGSGGSKRRVGEGGIYNTEGVGVKVVDEDLARSANTRSYGEHKEGDLIPQKPLGCSVQALQ
jgi:hypothetical protein